MHIKNRWSHYRLFSWECMTSIISQHIPLSSTDSIAFSTRVIYFFCMFPLFHLLVVGVTIYKPWKRRYMPSIRSGSCLLRSFWFMCCTRCLHSLFSGIGQNIIWFEYLFRFRLASSRRNWFDKFRLLLDRVFEWKGSVDLQHCCVF